jgi:two-component system, LytTR family, sensor kinase
MWTFIGFLAASQLYGFLQVKEQNVSFLNAVLLQTPGWILWGLLSPFVWYVGNRFRLDKGLWLKHFPIHLAALIVFALFHLTFLAANRYWWDAEAYQTATFASFYFFTVLNYFHTELLVYGTILGLGYAGEFYRQYNLEKVLNAELREKLTAARLETLKVQLNPHFLFNTLNSVSTLVRKNDAQAAIEMLSGLGDLLRHTLKQTESQQVTLVQEIEFARKYLALEQIRFQDRLQIKFEIEAEADELGVPTMILQPLIENAVRHGIARRSAASSILVKAWRETEKICFEITDDGGGLPANWENNIGIGIGNTLSRLQSLYGANFDFALTNLQPHGTRAKLCIPAETVKNDG